MGLFVPFEPSVGLLGCNIGPESGRSRRNWEVFSVVLGPLWDLFKALVVGWK